MAFTDALQRSFKSWILFLIADSFADAAQMICFSTDDTVLPSLELVTNSLVTGIGMMLFRR